jgi:hypothetical protein
MIDAPAARDCEPPYGRVVVLSKYTWDDVRVVEIDELARPIQFALKRGARYPDVTRAPDGDRRFSECRVMKIAFGGFAELMMMPLSETRASDR